MTKKEVNLIPYEDTVYTVFIKRIKGKYLQNIFTPNMIAQIPLDNKLNIHYIDRGELSVWYPLQEKWGSIPLDDFNKYAIINEEQFKEYQSGKIDLSKILLAHKDAPIFENIHKPNQSEQSHLGIIVDKSKATKTVNMKVTPFPNGSRLNPSKKPHGRPFL